MESFKPPSTYGEYLKEALPLIYYTIAGLAASSLIGNFLIFLGALCFGISSVLPRPYDLTAVRNKVEKIRSAFEKSVGAARGDPEKIKKAKEIADTELEIEKLLETTYKGDRWKGQASMLFLGKDALKVAGFTFLILGFMLSAGTIPLTGLVGVIIGFAAYFSFNPEKKAKKEDN